MWPELVRELQRFPDAVLTGLDGAGSPVSVRRRLRPEPACRQLRCPRAMGVELVEGPASLLCHRHDERLWRLRSFAVHGSLTHGADEWVFTPSRLVAGPGMAGPLGDLRGFVAARGEPATCGVTGWAAPGALGPISPLSSAGEQ